MFRLALIFLFSLSIPFRASTQDITPQVELGGTKYEMAVYQQLRDYVGFNNLSGQVSPLANRKLVVLGSSVSCDVIGRTSGGSLGETIYFDPPEGSYTFTIHAVKSPSFDEASLSRTKERCKEYYVKSELALSHPQFYFFGTFTCPEPCGFGKHFFMADAIVFAGNHADNPLIPSVVDAISALKRFY
jgi:hypothetical protein